ncbi:hypothetical protein Maq22A_2p40920 (plasmid) [Methylobacterium aquaticum]|uniref:Uncharacterized protein n=1 Tax=Methylobacterium aquaticum TaxID=270351 RepID=A0A0C6FNN9_9HYPH|nr:hypothetical protein Maq22A_2p40920 [Methylobacterium aquaticum]
MFASRTHRPSAYALLPDPSNLPPPCKPPSTGRDGGHPPSRLCPITARTSASVRRPEADVPIADSRYATWAFATRSESRRPTASVARRVAEDMVGVTALD